MAHIMKLKHSQVGGNFLAHIERTRGDKSKYGNQDIDSSRTHLNYSLTGGHRWQDEYRDGWEAGERYRESWSRIVERQKRKPRTDTVGLGSAIITLPEEYKGLPSHMQADFFQECHDFLHGRYGSRGNEIYSEVHMDETTPHLHYGFIPVTADGRISAKEVLNRQDLQRLHSDLDKHLRKSLEWYKGGVLRDCDSPRQYVSLDEFKKMPEKARRKEEEVSELKKTLSSPSRLTGKVKLSAELQKTLGGLISASSDLMAGHGLLEENKKRQELLTAREKELVRATEALQEKARLVRTKEQELIKFATSYKELQGKNKTLSTAISKLRKSTIEILATNEQLDDKENRPAEIAPLIQLFKDIGEPLKVIEVKDRRKQIQEEKKSKQLDKQFSLSR